MVASLAVRDYLWCNIDSMIYGWWGPCVTRLQAFIPPPDVFLHQGCVLLAFSAGEKNP